MDTLSTSPSDLQSHIYSALLHGKTSDIALRVRGAWSAVYKLHRLVLIQSEFFLSLFTAGFIESSPNKRNSEYGCEIVDISFPDRNITRAAFEVCIARLYGGGPSLHVSPTLIPTNKQPLTPSFPVLQKPEITPPNHHPATPPFLCSLLATSIYLSIPSLAAQALSLILSTVGPTTVLPYLNFALGKPLHPLNSLVSESQAAVGLENLALWVKGRSEEGLCDLAGSTSKLSETECFSQILSNLTIKEESSFSDKGSVDEKDISDDILCHYGAVSNKIGEACACWLTRWGIDMLSHETSQQRLVDDPLKTTPTVFEPQDIVESSLTLTPITIWGRGGLSAEWVAVLVSSDFFFVSNERHRYDIARTVVELRRATGLIPEEELEWAKMFETGIYYTNMSMEDIIAISNDISSVTKQPYVPLRVLQAAHWSQSVLQLKITSLPPSVSSPLPTCPREKELGIFLTTADIHTRIFEADPHNSMNVEEQKAYFPVPSDTSLRVGDNGTIFNGSTGGSPMSMEDLFKYSDGRSVAALHSCNGRTVQKQRHAQTPSPMISETTYFGILSPRQTGSGCVLSDNTGKTRWSPYPPYRFSVEFWDHGFLTEKNRSYSNTVWYAGSLFNVYIQIVRKKGHGQTQLGVYLHRQSGIDPIPSPSRYIPLCSYSNDEIKSEPLLSMMRSGDRHHHGRSSPSSPESPGNLTRFSPSIHPPRHTLTPLGRSPSPGHHSSSLSNGSISHMMDTVTRAHNQQYRDPRAMISAYFMVSCASGTGSSQTRFLSAPGVFSIGQSWGWKSSSLITEEYVDASNDDDLEAFLPSPNKVKCGKEVSFRATVALGLV